MRVPIRTVIIAAAAIMILGSSAWGFSRTQRAVVVSTVDAKSARVTGPLTVNFSQELAAGFVPSISPKPNGSWEVKRGFLGGVTAVEFKPRDRLQAGGIYTLKITNLKRLVTSRPVDDVSQIFTVQTAPDIVKTSPSAGAKNITVKPRFSLTLETANRGLRKLQPSLTPAVPLKLVSSDDKTFEWQPTQQLAQGTAYTFAVDDTHIANPVQRRVLSTTFTTVSQPAITSARTGGYFNPGQTVEIVFDQAMVQSKDAFEFGVAGGGGWKNDHTYSFTPENLKPGTTYNYKVKAGLRSMAGGVLETDRPFQFATPGAVLATSLSPSGSDKAVNSAIRITFDQAVDHASAQSKFSISPAVAGNFSWSGTTMIFTPAGLGHQTGYAYGVGAGIVPSFGLPSNRAFTSSFVTAAQITMLNVPIYKQVYGNGCELASLRMALAYRGIAVSEWDVVMRIGYNPRNRDTATNTWDNPNLTYVGFLNGYQNSSGYGVHAGPIANASKSLGRNASAHFGVSPSFIASQVHAGNPVVFWGHSTPAKADAWNVPGGGVAQAWLSAHARVVYGVAGPASNPIGFYINDPWTGSRLYWTPSQLSANMNVIPGVSNQAVVVY